MKELDIIIPHEQLGALNEILHKHKVGGMYFVQITGRGKAERKEVEIHVETYKTGKRYVPEFGSRTMVVVVIPDSMQKPVVDDILSRLSTGEASDGKIFVKDIHEAYDIGTKASGEKAAL
ncbi:MAG TPA: P-II family nitrogen regulator [Nitrososphaera sp.]|jgi:nitrogen regulatory protein P-II 1